MFLCQCSNIDRWMLHWVVYCITKSDSSSTWMFETVYCLHVDVRLSVQLFDEPGITGFLMESNERAEASSDVMILRSEICAWNLCQSSSPSQWQLASWPCWLPRRSCVGYIIRPDKPYTMLRPPDSMMITFPRKCKLHDQATNGHSSLQINRSSASLLMRVSAVHSMLTCWLYI